GLLGLAMRGSERFRRLPGLLRFAAGVAARRGLAGFSRGCFLRDRPPPFSSRSGPPFAQAARPPHPPPAAVGGGDDRVGQPSRPAPVPAQGLVGLLPAGPQRGHPLQLLLQLRDRQLPALQTVARPHTLLDYTS